MHARSHCYPEHSPSRRPCLLDLYHIHLLGKDHETMSLKDSNGQMLLALALQPRFRSEYPFEGSLTGCGTSASVTWRRPGRDACHGGQQKEKDSYESWARILSRLQEIPVFRHKRWLVQYTIGA